MGVRPPLAEHCDVAVEWGCPLPLLLLHTADTACTGHDAACTLPARATTLPACATCLFPSIWWCWWSAGGGCVTLYDQWPSVWLSGRSNHRQPTCRTTGGARSSRHNKAKWLLPVWLYMPEHSTCITSVTVYAWTWYMYYQCDCICLNMVHVLPVCLCMPEHGTCITSVTVYAWTWYMHC